MNDVLGLVTVSDVVLLAIISNAFWLTILLVCISFFRSEIRALLSSLSSVSIAGSHFELGDKSLTLKSYTILSHIFLDLLCNSANTDKLIELFSEVNAQQLTKFTIKYLIEAPKDEINFPLIRNVAAIAGRKGRLQDSISLYNFLIEKAPTDLDLRNELGNLLILKDAGAAKKIYGELKTENPGIPTFRFNYALADLSLNNFDEAIAELELLINEGSSMSIPSFFDWPAMKKLARVRPEEYQRLIALKKADDERSQKDNLA